MMSALLRLLVAEVVRIREESLDPTSTPVTIDMLLAILERAHAEAQARESYHAQVQRLREQQ